MTGGFGFQSSWNVNQSDSENVMNAKRICLAMKGDIESQTHPTKSQVLQYLSALSVYYTSFNQLMKENNLVILAWKNKKWMTKNKQTKEGEWVKVEDLLQNRITWYKKQIRSAKNPKLWEFIHYTLAPYFNLLTRVQQRVLPLRSGNKQGLTDKERIDLSGSSFKPLPKRKK